MFIRLSLPSDSWQQSRGLPQKSQNGHTGFSLTELVNAVFSKCIVSRSCFGSQHFKEECGHRVKGEDEVDTDVGSQEGDEVDDGGSKEGDEEDKLESQKGADLVDEIENEELSQGMYEQSQQMY